jgi:flagella basal body P-ring formation protein FlgA
MDETRRWIEWFLFWIITTLLVLLVVSDAVAGILVALRNEEVLADSGEIKLGSIATLEGADPLTLRRLGQLWFGQAPGIGEKKIITQETVKLRLRQAGMNLREISFVGPGSVAVNRATQVVSPEAIVETAQTLLIERLQGDSLIEITPVQRPPEQLLPAGRLMLRALPKGEIAALVPMVVEISVDGVLQRQVPLTLRVDRSQLVVVATRPIRRLASLSADDLRLEKRLISGLPAGPLARIGDALGFVTSREIRGGEVLSTKLIQLPALVKRGEVVTLIVEGQGLSISALGQAKEEGQRGQMIRVMNLSSKKELYGRVEGERQVRILY